MEFPPGFLPVSTVWRVTDAHKSYRDNSIYMSLLDRLLGTDTEENEESSCCGEMTIEEIESED
ncbi:hypothetical protein HSRCO_0782 [Halanaeroarchaeum sp. HSR-CO]|nr:hypothetical protein HSRCO_0782 [Halanaeroarchaeum sp. HSR-CO]